MDSATLSECGLYRHALTRRVNDRSDKILHFIMLNPSTADAETDDATIRKCKGFCERLGYGLIQVSNIFDYRATDPKELKTAKFPASPHNLNCIRAACAMSDKTIAAWGTHGTLYRQNEKVMAHIKDYDLYALALSKDGHPKHPLYIPYDTAPIIFRSKQ